MDGVSLRFSEFVRQREAGLRRMLALFESNHGWRPLYATGPDSDLLGRPLAELDATTGTPARVELDSDEALDAQRPGARVVPSAVSGRIHGDLESGARLAVAVNGVVRGATRTFRHGGETRFGAIVPPDSFVDRPDSLEILVVRGTGAGRRVVPLGVERPVEYRLAEESGATTIVGGGRNA